MKYSPSPASMDISLARSRVKAQEKERSRMAHYLHDQLGQQVSAAHLLLRAAILRKDQRIRQKLIRQCDLLLTGLQTEIRNYCWQLWPAGLEAADLGRALRSLAVVMRTQCKMELRCSGLPASSRLGPELSNDLFRLVQDFATLEYPPGAARQLRIKFRERFAGLEILMVARGTGFESPVKENENDCRRDIENRVLALAGQWEWTRVPGAGIRCHIRIPLPKKII